MEELIETVASKTGIPKDKAEKAVETVIAFLKDRLPGPIASQIDGLIDKHADKADDAIDKIGDMAKGLGIFGKK